MAGRPRKNNNEQRVVEWFVAKRSMIKFQGDEDSTDIAQNVMEVSNFDKYPILKGDTVEVGMKDGEVVFLRKVKGAKKETKKTETKSSETTTASNSETKTVTIFAVAGNKKVVKFEKEGQWIPVSDEVQTKDYRELGLIAKNEVTVVLTDGTITDVKVVATSKEETKNETKSTKRTNSYRDEDSVDKRTASMNAKDLVVALINTGKITSPEKLKENLTDLTKSIYNDIMSL